MAKKTFQEEYESIGTFLILELLALVSFGLGGVSVIFQYAGFLVAVVATFFAFRNYSKADLKPILYIGVPLFLFSIFVSFGKFFESFSILENIGAFLSITSFLAIGLSARRMKSFSSRNALLCVGFGLAAITLVSLVITWINYGLFYTLIHKDAGNYYYNGNLYSVLNEMQWLNGFKISEVTLKYGSLFAVLCASFLPAVLFVNYKENKVVFISTLVIGGIGLLAIVTIPNFIALIFVAIAYLAALYFRFLRDKQLANKIVRVSLLVIFGFILLGFFFAMLNLSIPQFNDFIANNSFLNKVFNTNIYMRLINPILEAALKPFNLFGINTLTYYDGYRISNEALITNTGIFEVEILKEGGVIAFLLFLVFALFAFDSFGRYLKNSKDHNYIKVILLTFLVGFVLYSTFNNEVFPLTHNSLDYHPFTRSLPFFIVLFIVGYTVLPEGKAEVEFVAHEVKEVEKKTKVDDDYDFGDAEEEEII